MEKHPRICKEKYDGGQAQEIKQDGLGRINKRVFAGIVSTTKLSLRGELFLEISARKSMETQLKIGEGTPGLRFRSMTLGLPTGSVHGTGEQGTKAPGCHPEVYRETLHFDNRHNGRVKRKTIVRY